MAYGRRKKSSKVRGKSLINKMSKDVSPDPIIDETPTPPPAQMESNQETDYQTETPPAEILAPPVEQDISNQSITDDVSEPTLSVEEQQEQRTSRINRAITNRSKTGNQKGSKKQKTVFTRTPTPQGEPIPTPPPEPELIPIVTTLYDGANVRQFYGIKNTPIEEFISDVLIDVPLFKINGVDEKGNILNTYQVEDDSLREPEGMSDVKATAGGAGNDKNGGKNGGKNGMMGGKNGGKDNNKSGKNKEDKFSIVKGDKSKKGSYKTKTFEEKRSLTEIVEEIQYNIAVDGVPGQPYPITYMGLENPDVVPQYMYEQPPIERIPASLPESYQNSANEGVEELKDGRRCANCIFYDPEVSNCSKWNAEVRQYYWCLSWQTMEPVIAQPNQFTDLIVEDGDIYDYFLTRVKNPTTQEPNLSNFLSPLNPLFATFGAYIYGDYLRRIVDSGDAFDYDGIPINFFFTTQDGFLNAIDFINNANLTQFNDPPETYDSIQQHLVTYTLSKKSTSTLPSNYPQTITINLHGQYYGEPKNILSQLDLVNAKIAYNPQYTVDTHNILIDSRFTVLEGRGVIHIDIIKQSIRERLLKFLVDNSKVYKLDGRSSYKFIKWVANRSAFSESIQSLYQYLLTVSSISSDDQNLLDNIERSLSERLFDDPSNTPISLTTKFAGTNNNVSTNNQSNNAVVIAQQGTGNAGRDEVTPQGTRNEGTRNVGGGQITQQGTGNVGGGY